MPQNNSVKAKPLNNSFMDSFDSPFEIKCSITPFSQNPDEDFVITNSNRRDVFTSHRINPELRIAMTEIRIQRFPHLTLRTSFRLEYIAMGSEQRPHRNTQAFFTNIPIIVDGSSPDNFTVV